MHSDRSIRGFTDALPALLPAPLHSDAASNLTEPSEPVSASQSTGDLRSIVKADQRNARVHLSFTGGDFEFYNSFDMPPAEAARLGRLLIKAAAVFGVTQMKDVLTFTAAGAIGVSFACGIKYVFAAFLIAFLLLGNQ